jgi:predicted nucleic acid-binding protein
MLTRFTYTALLDANVLYPAPLRDYLLSLAELELFQPKWSDRIQEEWINNLLLNRPDLNPRHLEKTRKAMDNAFPDAKITNYEGLISNLSLPDPNDRHILAAAIKASAPIIVTSNLKDFPIECLKCYDTEVQHPDEFISNLIFHDKTSALEALNNQVKRLRNPPMSIDDVLLILEKCGLKNTVANLKI